MDTNLARKMWRTLEPYHGMIYFAPQAIERYEQLGLSGRATYFAPRAAPMGAVPASVVIATFFNFNPKLVEKAIPDAWTKATPAQLLEARLAGADAALRDSLGDEALASSEMVEAAELARIAAEGCTAPGRPLYAAHAELPWPAEPHLALWHAISLLREFRGDGHIAALVVEGIDGCEALVTHGSEGVIPPAILQSTRGWSDEEWAAAEQRLEDRGWRKGGEVTPLGVEVRERVERLTDERAMAPWETLGQERSDQLRRLVRPFSKAISSGGVFLNRPD